MLQPDSALVREMLSFTLLIDALRDAFIQGVEVPLRHSHIIGDKDHPGTSLLMPAWDLEGFYGVKIVNIFPENYRRQIPGLHSTYLLYSASSGEPLALFDGNEITSRRTAAAAALGASYLARGDAHSLLVVGAGRVGSLVAPAMAAVRRLDRVQVWDIHPEAAHRCAQELRELGLPAHVTDDLEAACRNADIVSCATLATAPLIQPEWLAEGSHLDLIGSFTPQMTEAAPGCFANASVWVDTSEAIAKSGDLLNAFSTGALREADIRGDLTSLCRELKQGRRDERERTVFKAVGTALEDLAAARLIYRRLAGTSL